MLDYAATYKGTLTLVDRKNFRRNPKTNDHWWPVALQKYWADEAGNVNFIKSDRKEGGKRYYNEKLGVRRGGHYIDLGNSPWTSSFEEVFQEVDQSIPDLIARISNLRPQAPLSLNTIMQAICYCICGDGRVNNPMTDSIAAFTMKHYNINDELYLKILDLVISLIVRSPRFRYIKSLNPVSFGLPPCNVVATAEIYEHYSIAEKFLSSKNVAGHFLFLRSVSKEFIYGDGMLDGLSSSLKMMALRGSCFIAITPRLGIFYSRDVSSSVLLRASSCYVSDSFVRRMNSLTQIYSKDQIFYRFHKPEIDDAFFEREFLKIENHQDDHLNALAEFSYRDQLL